MEQNDSLIAQAYTVPTGYTADVTDNAASHTVTLTAGVYRTFAAKGASGAGTEINPWELLYKFRVLLDVAQWNITLLASGRIRITYLAAAAGGEIVWASGLGNLFGFTSDVGPLATNAYQDSDALPTHCVFFAACDDSGWTRTPGRFSGARMPNGIVYGWADKLQGLTRRLTLKLLPKDDTTRAALIVSDPTSSPPTPCFGVTSRVTSPATGEPGQVPPWGAIETFATAGARSLGVMLGTLQTAIATPASAPFDHCYLTPETVTGGAEVRLSVELYDPRRDIASVDLAFYAAETR